MKIGINGQIVLTDKFKFTGPQVYDYSLISALAKTDKSNEYVIYLPHIPEELAWQNLVAGNTNFSYKVLPTTISWTQWALAWELLINPVDIYFTATHTIPFLRNPRQKIITMIHGLEWKKNNQYSGKPLHKFIHPFVLWWTIMFSNILVVPSQATLQAILDTNWPFVTRKKLSVIYEGVERDFYKRSEDEVTNVRQKYNLKKPYLLFLSTIQPRKNIPRTIEAFSKLANKNIELVIAGKNGWDYEASLEAPAKYGVEDRVKFLGRIVDEDRPALMSGASAYVNFSLEEGFGLPLAEAMACNAKCAVSDIPAFKEIGGDYPVFADPLNADDISDKLEQALVAPTKPYVPKFTWENTAHNMLRIFQELA